MHSYHITCTRDDGSQGEHCDLYPDGADAGLRAIELFPDAYKINVLRLSTVLLRRPGAEAHPPAPTSGRAA